MFFGELWGIMHIKYEYDAFAPLWSPSHGWLSWRDWSSQAQHRSPPSQARPWSSNWKSTWTIVSLYKRCFVPFQKSNLMIDCTSSFRDYVPAHCLEEGVATLSIQNLPPSEGKYGRLPPTPSLWYFLTKQFLKAQTLLRYLQKNPSHTTNFKK